MRAITGSDYTQVVLTTTGGSIQAIPVLVYGLGMMPADESADTQEFYAGSTAPPLAVVLDSGMGLALNGTGWTYRVRIYRKSDGIVVVDQPATFSTDADGRPVLTYAWTAGSIAAAAYWYDFVATETATGGILITPKRTFQVRPPV